MCAPPLSTSISMSYASVRTFACKPATPAPAPSRSSKYVPTPQRPRGHAMSLSKGYSLEKLEPDGTFDTAARRAATASRYVGMRAPRAVRSHASRDLQLGRPPQQLPPGHQTSLKSILDWAPHFIRQLAAVSPPGYSDFLSKVVQGGSIRTYHSLHRLLWTRLP